MRTVRMHALFWAFTCAASIFIGASVAGKTQVYVGDQVAKLVVGAAAACALFVTFGAIGFPVVLAWGVLTGLAYPFVHFGSLISFDRLWVVGMVGSLALTRGISRHSRVSSSVLLALNLFALTFGLRAVTTGKGAVQTWINAILVPLVLFLVVRGLARPAKRAQQVAGSLMLGGGVLAVLGLATLVTGLDLAKYSGGEVRLESGLGVRLSGPYPAPEPYALSLLTCFAATLFWLMTRRTDGLRLVGLGFAGLELTAIGFTLFRAAWIGAVLVVIAAFGLRPRRFGRLLFVAGLAAAVLFTATTQLAQTRVVQQRVDNTDNIYGRLATYKQGLEIFRSAPLFGVGVDQYHPVADLRPPVRVNNVESVTYAHSSFIGLLAEQGLVGFVPFILVGFLVVRMIRSLMLQAVDRADAALAGAAAGAALAYVVMSATLTMLPYGPSNAFLAVLLGLVAARLDDALPVADPAVARVVPPRRR